ncbi:MAG: hypothetical protein BA869_06255 [Desulfuromonadales bacterium C00003107]|jgi:hypothetical protein|nr:MAG: hypothetical protein BA869_06255 [Desulfuromonadales bacterium C00003107]
MPVGTGKIIREIREFIASHGEDYGNWYIGITTDPISRLLDDHKVDINVDLWLCSEAFSNKEARMVEEQLISETGVTGDCQDGKTGQFVYAYRMSDNTQP